MHLLVLSGFTQDMALRKYLPSGHASSLSMAPLNLSDKVQEKAQFLEPEAASGPPVEDDVDIDLSEVYFLIMHFLSAGPCHRTYGQFWNELLEHQLLPRRYHSWYSRSGAHCRDENDNGFSFPLSYNKLVERYPHVQKDHLVKLLKQLILTTAPPLHGMTGGNAPNAADVPTLLGSGSFSLLESDRNSEEKQINRPPGYLRWPHLHSDQVRGLSLREIGGGFSKHHRAPSIRAACYAIAKPSTMVQRMENIKKLRGHRDAVYCAILDRSGRYVITGSDDRLVKIWSMETAFCLASCRGHEGDITDLSVSSNNAWVASASNDCIIRVWRLPDGYPIAVLRGHTGAVTAIAFSPRPSTLTHLLSKEVVGPAISTRLNQVEEQMCQNRMDMRDQGVVVKTVHHALNQHQQGGIAPLSLVDSNGNLPARRPQVQQQHQHKHVVPPDIPAKQQAFVLYPHRERPVQQRGRVHSPSRAQLEVPPWAYYLQAQQTCQIPGQPTYSPHDPGPSVANQLWPPDHVKT
ncbi:hypothetical protein IFM89_026240 [Coptis chinensis]|uniref:BRWD/PHIP N-terminal domain-containing protein n=1 Tax=Coptis chinensis TaxID=261450 RepID=A0A835LT40_9MAGN|nr:hypothetical protein IFM89_026240 [Coptis chinensis]